MFVTLNKKNLNFKKRKTVYMFQYIGSVVSSTSYNGIFQSLQGCSVNTCKCIIGNVANVLGLFQERTRKRQ